MYAADTAPPLDGVKRQILNFIEVFELNGSGWVFSNFQNLQLTLWQLDPLRGRAFIPLPRWIQTRRAVVNVAGTGDDYFWWAILASMHPVDVNADRRVKYAEHMGKYDFSSLSFPVPLQAMVDDDNEVIYPLRVSSTLVPDRHVDLLLFERDGVQHYVTIRNFSRLVGRQLATMDTSSAVDVAYTPTRARSCWMLMLSIVAMRKGPNFTRTRRVDSPISRNNC